MSEIVKLADLDAITGEAAKWWVRIAKQSVEARGRFTVALSGGSTPQNLYQLLASAPWSGELPWQDTYVFFGDERRVPHSHPESNYRVAYESLLSQVQVPAEQVFPMPGTGLARSAERDYDRVLERHFELKRGEFPRFDLMLAGLGEDGHFGSIFPGTRAVTELSGRVLIYEVPQLNRERMTLTIPVFNHARNVVFLVSGAAKADALHNHFHAEYRPSTYPTQNIKMVDGTLTWLVDTAAASRLE